MSAPKNFNELDLPENLLSALNALGYESPTPIQEQSIPVLLEGGDLLAQAQTGTGKTASFALPILAQIDLELKAPQALVIAPTRELAIQVAEAFQSYAKHTPGFHVAPIYGGQDYKTQLKALKRGPHVIVGTPGRIMDHLRRNTLSVKSIKTLVLDEADEMLRMGFIDDIEWILEQIPHTHQTVLFSATMPSSIQKIANCYLKDAKKIKIAATEQSNNAIEQYYIRVARNQKIEALTRYLEVEDLQATLIFSRTKTATEELAEKLLARGYAAAALNGDMKQSMRQRVIEQIKKGTLDIIIATDVAARGIDIDRISHVINFDIPHDTESYIHRIGRTGRAGRTGKALTFVTAREGRLLRDIERAVKKPIVQIEPPSIQEMNEKRSQLLAEKVINVLKKTDKLTPYHGTVEYLLAQAECGAEDLAAALAYLLHQSNPLPTHDMPATETERKPRSHRGRTRRDNGDKRARKGKGRDNNGKKAWVEEKNNPKKKKEKSKKAKKKSRLKDAKKLGKKPKNKSPQ